MKKLLPLIAILASMFIYTPSTAQCSISDLKVRLTDVNTSTCEVTFDLSWTQEVNSGNKFAYIHMWTQTAYHTPVMNWVNMYSNTGSFPMGTDLVNALSTFVIEDNHADFPYLGTNYYPDPVYNLPPTTGMSVVKVHLGNTLIERMTLQNIRLSLPSCTGAQTIYFDIWASQAANGKNVHCASQGASIVINELKVTGDIICTNPAQFRIFIQNFGPAIDSVSYKVYLDAMPQAILNPSDTLVYTSGYVTVPANGFYSSPITDYLPYSATNPTAAMPLIVEVVVPNRPNTLIASILNGCGPLPVRFTAFTAVQAKDKIVLNWQTASEQNNRGFEIQRMLPGGPFEPVAWVPSMAPGGNSEELLNYTYYDLADLKAKGQVYYRIKQTGLDGNSSFSDTRVIKYSTSNILVYPNPSRGQVNIILPGNLAEVDMILTDMTGRQVNKWSNLAISNLTINNLKPGLYLLVVYVKQTGEKLQEKIVVQ